MSRFTKPEMLAASQPRQVDLILSLHNLCVPGSQQLAVDGDCSCMRWLLGWRKVLDLRIDRIEGHWTTGPGRARRCLGDPIRYLIADDIRVTRNPLLYNLAWQTR